jgi:hypothetical protein
VGIVEGTGHTFNLTVIYSTHTYIYIYIQTRSQCKAVSENVQQLTAQTRYTSLQMICLETFYIIIDFKLTVPVLISNIFRILSLVLIPRQLDPD